MASSDTAVRRRDAAASKARILAAARRCFSEMGYANTGIREVAAAAGVSYALLGRYFGSKAGLLEAALDEALTARPFLDGDRARLGERLALLIAGAPKGELPLSMTLLAAGDAEGRAIATRLVEAKIVGPIAEWLGGPDARERAVAITMLGAGFVTHYRLLPLIGQDGALGTDHPDLLWLAASVQRIVDDPEGWRAPHRP